MLGAATAASAFLRATRGAARRAAGALVGDQNATFTAATVGRLIAAETAVEEAAP